MRSELKVTGVQSGKPTIRSIEAIGQVSVILSADLFKQNKYPRVFVSSHENERLNSVSSLHRKLIPTKLFAFLHGVHFKTQPKCEVVM